MPMAITTLQRSVNARRQQAPKHAVAENHGRRGRSSTAAKSTLFSSEGAELAVFFPKTRFRVGGVADGISDFSVKKPISVFDRIEKLGRAARKLMFASFPVHSEATQQLLQTWLFQHANASQCSNMHCSRRIMLWAWMLWQSHSLEDERNYALGMDALVIAVTRR